MSLEQDTPASRAFASAYDDPDNFDFGMEAERADSGFANFDFDPQEAANMRQEELNRMADAQVPDLRIGSKLALSGHLFKVIAIHKHGVALQNSERSVTLTHDEAFEAMKQMQEIANYPEGLTL